MASIRQQKAAERIHQIISTILQTEVSDPRLYGVTVTEVKVDREMRHANIYVGALDDTVEKKEVLAGLRSASGYLRRELSQQAVMRHTPQLNFHWDPSPARAQRVSNLLDGLDIPPADESAEADSSADID